MTDQLLENFFCVLEVQRQNFTFDAIIVRWITVLPYACYQFLGSTP